MHQYRIIIDFSGSKLMFVVYDNQPDDITVVNALASRPANQYTFYPTDTASFPKIASDFQTQLCLEIPGKNA
jgi:hypothetical protein